MQLPSSDLFGDCFTGQLFLAFVDHLNLDGFDRLIWVENKKGTPRDVPCQSTKVNL